MRTYVLNFEACAPEGLTVEHHPFAAGRTSRLVISLIEKSRKKVRLSILYVTRRPDIP
jgi:hypothetical protein